ncbi:MAG: pyruvate ferredoxin oxidoreductase, partial [Thermoplasmata archaeon]
MTKVLTGSGSVANAVKFAFPDIIAAYPITPQTEIVEDIATMIKNKELASRFIKVDSEHSAMSACIGASATGARTFTATSSHGLMY